MAANQPCSSGALADSTANGNPIEAANKPMSQSAMPLVGGAPNPCAIPIGSVAAAAASMPIWMNAPSPSGNLRTRRWA